MTFLSRFYLYWNWLISASSSNWLIKETYNLTPKRNQERKHKDIAWAMTVFWTASYSVLFYSILPISLIHILYHNFPVIIIITQIKESQKPSDHQITFLTWQIICLWPSMFLCFVVNFQLCPNDSRGAHLFLKKNKEKDKHRYMLHFQNIIWCFWSFFSRNGLSGTPTNTTFSSQIIRS